VPKGGGAIRGIGEKFAANPVTGTGSLTVPIALSPGRSGFGPQLVLSYDSGAGNGPFGFGWSLSLPEITRRTDKGLPRFEDGAARESDVFILSGAEDLVPVLVESKGDWVRPKLPTRTLPDGTTWNVERYRPRVEGLFARIERWTNVTSGESHWRSISKDNVTTLYGLTDESRIADPDDPTRRVFSWLICESYDDRGNAVVYRYTEENGDGVATASAHERNRTSAGRSVNRHLKRITYGNVTPRQPGEDLKARTDWLFEVVLDYGEHNALKPRPHETGVAWLCRDDPFSSYRAGFEIRTYRLCQRILMFHHFPNESNIGADCLVRSTDLAYRHGAIGSFLTSVSQSGYRRKGNTYVPKSLPPLELDYTRAVVQQAVRWVDEDSVENLPFGVDGSRFQWVDLDGEGLSGVLTEQAEGWFYKRNLSPLTNGDGHEPAASLSPVALVAEKPSLAKLESGRQQLLDLAGDGQLDLVEFAQPLSGFYERTEEEGWHDFVPFESMPNVAWDDPNLRLVDLTGDGHADVLIASDGVFTWHPSLAEDGFAPAERTAQALDDEHGPRVVFADGTESIQLADLSGDGLVDLVRIRNGEVCYWPNLGYGRFGPRVSMDRAPWFDAPDLFDPKRVRLADIDGSGVTDIVYLGRQGVQLYFNESGNGWSSVHPLAVLPPVDGLSSVQVVDLLGNGTACLVWSSPLPGDGRRPLRYVDLMGGQKPHLLQSVRNNLGAETQVIYAPSTRFYLQDRLAGKPWVTRLPFPVHVVERVETYDRISQNWFVTRYAYHHGYFDGVEREFRGFGLVEQWDTEQFVALSKTGVLEMATNLDDASHIPPMCTKTWFHTGAYVDGSRISRQFEHEYYSEDLASGKAERMLLDDTVLPTTVRTGGKRVTFELSPEEQREAARALKSSILRQEIYALDGQSEAERPYSVSERNHTLEMLQPLGVNRHAVFFTHPRETVDFHYERKLYDVGGKSVADPRVTHTLTLETDDFGNVLLSAMAAYGRRYDDPDAALTSNDRKRQKQTVVTYTETGFTNAVDDDDACRVPLVCDTRTYELLNVAPTSSEPHVTNLLTFDDLLEPEGILERAADGSHDLPYETLSGSGPRRRLVEHVRVLYRRDDLTAALPLGELESLALTFEGYRLAFPKTLLAHVYQRRSKGGTVQNLLPNPLTVMAAAGYRRSKDLKTSGVFPASDPVNNWWIPSGNLFYSDDQNDTASQELIAAQAHFFLPRRYHDVFNQVTVVDYDNYNLLVQETRDALGNAVTAGRRNTAGALVANGNDYRVLQPGLVMDPNRNRSEVLFDALGLVTATAVMGKPNQQLGDSLRGVESDLSELVVVSHLQDPLDDPQSILGGATTRLVYDLFAYVRTRGDAQPQPPVVYTLAREAHESDLGPNEKTKVQHSFSYSDGFGREIQRKSQVEPGPQGSKRWVGSGWTIFNNKGKRVRQYEPFFSATHRFEFAKAVGVSSILVYDPLGRVCATVFPNHTYEKVSFDPWRQESWDANDTLNELHPERDVDVGALLARLPAVEYRPTWLSRMRASSDARERAAGEAASEHAGTPTTTWLDPLGRAFVAIAHNRFKRNSVTVEEKYRSRLEIDIEGNEREVLDARDRTALRSDFDMLGHPIHTASMDAGDRWTFYDAVGKPLLVWDSRGHKLATVYDALRRPTEVRLRDKTAPDEVVQQTIYGETRPNAEANNLRGKVFRVLDAAGELTTDNYDFKGALKRSRRRLAVDYETRLDWSTTVPLESTAFETTTSYDALSRIVEIRTPDGSVLRPFYNKANLLEKLEGNLRGASTKTRFVDDVDYDAIGRRTLISYANGVRTDYTYDPETFRLKHLLTTRGSDVLQDLRYTYDPVGNVTHVQDEAQQTIFFANSMVKPHAEFTYDAVYRLVLAAGRERLGLATGGDTGTSAPAVLAGPDALGRYEERYTYDAVGNISELFHASLSPIASPWKVGYAYDEPSLLENTQKSNQLTSTTVGAGPVDQYSHDAHGNMTSMRHLQVMRWDHRDQLQATAKQSVGPGATPETTYYVHDAAGQRVRKVTESYAGVGQIPTRMKERIYIGGFETYREYDATGQNLTLERETLLVHDGDRRLALVETRTAGTDSSAAQLTRYQLTNHLGSSSLELDASAKVISYEEYFPYGGTSYQAAGNLTETPKRYRYTGKERDEESGLYYHGARYYVPWIGRWTRCDPAMLIDGPNVYAYARGNPISYVDSSGTQAHASTFLTSKGFSARYAGRLLAGGESSPSTFLKSGGFSARHAGRLLNQAESSPATTGATPTGSKLDTAIDIARSTFWAHPSPETLLTGTILMTAKVLLEEPPSRTSAERTASVLSSSYPYGLGLGKQTSAWIAGDDNVSASLVQKEWKQNTASLTLIALPLVNGVRSGLRLLGENRASAAAFQEAILAQDIAEQNYVAALKGAPQSEVAGLKATIENMAWLNWRLSAKQFKRAGNQGLDLFFEGVGENRGLVAFGEGKGASGLGQLETRLAAIGGVRQGSRYYIGFNLETYIAQGGENAQLARDLIHELRAGNVKSFAGSSTGKLWELNYEWNADFTRNRGAAKLVHELTNL
jgi:RHS repeat-associated protein